MFSRVTARTEWGVTPTWRGRWASLTLPAQRRAARRTSHGATTLACSGPGEICTLQFSQPQSGSDASMANRPGELYDTAPVQAFALPFADIVRKHAPLAAASLRVGETAAVNHGGWENVTNAFISGFCKLAEICSVSF